MSENANAPLLTREDINRSLSKSQAIITKYTNTET